MTGQEITMAGKFEITKDKAGKFRFRLKAGNGEIIAVSEAYETMASAKNGIESVKKNAPEAKIEDLSEGSHGSGGVLEKGTSELPPGKTAGELAKGSGAAGVVE
jgi:uncharacterized protein YegP (UPF0339 family)